MASTGCSLQPTSLQRGTPGRRASALAARQRSMRRGVAPDASLGQRWRAGEATLLGLWGDGDAVHMALLDEAGGRSAGRQPGLPRAALSLRRPPRIRRRSGWSAPSATSTASSRGRARHAPLARSRPLGRAPAAGRARAGAGHGDAYAFLPAEGEALHQIPVGPGARRHHRARPFPLHRQRRDRGAPGGAAGLRAQGHRRPDGRRAARAGGQARRPRLRRQHRRLRPRLRPRRRGRARASSRRRAPSGCAR